jgi:hypothetical protein
VLTGSNAVLNGLGLVEVSACDAQEDDDGTTEADHVVVAEPADPLAELRAREPS